MFSRGSGPGGQHRNTADTAVSLTHVPSGLAVYCAGSRSQWENRQQARQTLQARLTAASDAAHAKTLNEVRAGQVVAERAAKAFTWNVQRGTVVEHGSGRLWRLRDFARGRI